MAVIIMIKMVLRKCFENLEIDCDDPMLNNLLDRYIIILRVYFIRNLIKFTLMNIVALLVLKTLE